jgi:cytochrome c peroxidase
MLNRDRKSNRRSPRDGFFSENSTTGPFSAFNEETVAVRQTLRLTSIGCHFCCLFFVFGASLLVGQEKSVNPGINKSFERPQVADFLARFEREGRDVFDHRHAIVEACHLEPGMAVTDIGAGTGLFTRLFSAKVGSQGRVYAVDIAENFVKHIERSAQGDRLANIVGVVCRPDHVNLPASSVDVAFICDTYHHFEFPSKTMRSIHQALRPGGQVVLIDFHRVEGVSRDWVLNHVRAGQEVFTKEILQTGFRQVGEKKGLLQESYFVLFVKTTVGKSKETDANESMPLVPLPKNVPAPKENLTTPAKVALGKQLFFDPRLSGDNTMSCATCHLPDKAFSDGLSLSKGDGGKILARNTQGLLNIGFFDSFFWDGRTRTLEEQALAPIQSPDEMNQNLAELEQELNAVPAYVEQFKLVFGTGVNRDGIAKSLAAFERTLVTGPSPFDRYLAGEQDALSEAAKRGLNLFTGDAGCVRCHHGALLSDGKFYRLGVSGKDKGRGAVTGKPEDDFKFRTPTLRNITQTGPYMHNGSQKTLDDVVTFYYRGIPESFASGLPVDVEPLLGQSFSDIPDVVEFLRSLSGPPPKIQPPELP